MKRKILILCFTLLMLAVSVTACTIRLVPLFNPQPNSTLLPAGTDKVELQVETISPAEVRYSVGEKLDYEMMTPFTEGAGGTTHKTTIPISPSPAETDGILLRRQ